MTLDQRQYAAMSKAFREHFGRAMPPPLMQTHEQHLYCQKHKRAWDLYHRDTAPAPVNTGWKTK